MQHYLTQFDSNSFTGTRRQNEIHTGRLLCWSSALVALTLWGTAQFFDRQNLHWHQQHNHMQQRESVNGEAALPESAAILRRLTAQYHQREAENR